MKQLALALTALTLSVSSLTAALAQQPITIDQIKDRLVVWFESGDEEGNLGNGGYWWNKYDPKKLDESVAGNIAGFEDDEFHNETDCHNVVAKGVKDGISSIQSDAYDETVAELLTEADKQGLVSEIVFNTWDPTQGGDGEACSIYTYYVFFKDGRKLILDYQHTD